MMMRRHEHSENPMNVVRDMLTKGTPVAPQKPVELLAVRTLPVPQESAGASLLEALDGKSANVEASECAVCGTKAAKKMKIPRHPKDPITRCPECGANKGPGKNTVRGATNYTGSAGSFYDESVV
jgi:hypothetical protein